MFGSRRRARATGSEREVRDALGEIGKAARDVSERMAPPERRRDRSEGR